MAKILVLDDQKERHDFYASKFAKHSVHHAVTSKGAIYCLKTNKFDYIFLDHDLGFTIDAPFGKNTGYEVAEWLSQNADFHKATKIVLHSWNSLGVKNMYEVLSKANYDVEVDAFPSKRYTT